MTNLELKNIVLRDIDDLEKDMTKEEYHEFLVELNHCVKEKGLKVLRRRCVG